MKSLRSQNVISGLHRQDGRAGRIRGLGPERGGGSVRWEGFPCDLQDHALHSLAVGIDEADPLLVART